MAPDNGYRPLNERWRNAKYLLAGFLLAGALLLTANWEADRRERARMDAFRDRIADLARISETNLSGQLRDFDNTLLVLRGVYGADLKRFIESIALLRNGPLADRSLMVVLVDRDGYLAYTDYPGAKPRVYLGDRTYFRYFADGGKDRLYIDEPTHGRVTGRHILPIARPIYDGRGGFLGVVAISVLQQSLVGFDSGFELSGDTTITVVNHDGAIVSRSRDLNKLQGTKIQPELLTPMLEGTEGVFWSRSTPDGAGRIIAYRHIHNPETPLVVYVDASPGHVLRDVSMQRTVLMGSAGFISLSIIVLIAFYLKGRKLTAQLIETLRRSKEQEYEVLTQTSLDGFFIADNAGRILDANGTFCKMLGYNRDELTGLSIPDIEASELPEPITVHILKVREDASDRFLSRIRRKDDAIIDVEVSTQHLEQQNGRFFVFVRDITDRKRTEQALMKSEEKYRELVENINDVVYELDGQGVIQYVSPSVERVLGYTQTESIGRSIADVLDTEDRMPAVANIRNAMVGSTPPNEYRVHRKSGETCWIRVSSSPVWKGDRVVGIRGILSDITEHKKAEAELQDKEHLLSESQRIAHIGSWSWDLSGPFKWTDETYRIYGVSPETFTPTVESLINLLHPEDRPAMVQWIETYAAGQSPDDLEFRVILPDGSVRLLSGRGQLIYETENRPAYMAGTVNDVTEQRKMERALERERRDIQTILDAAPVMVVYKSKDDHIVKVNNAFAEFIGLPKEKIIGKTTFDIVNRHEVAQQVRDHDLEVIRTEKPVLNQLVNWSGFQSRKEIWVLYSKFPFYDSDGTLTGTLSFVLDIDELKQAEKALRESEEMLARFMESATEGFILFDSNLNHVVMNPMALAITGLNLQNVKGRNIVDTVPGIRESGRYDAYKEVMRTGKPLHLDDITDHPLTGRKYIDLNAFRVGEGLGITFTDITHRKQVEEALKASREQLRALAGRLQTVREEERIRIAREIHDEMGGTLTGMKVDASFLTKLSEKITSEAVRTSLLTGIDAINTSIDTTIQTMRRIAMELRPSVLDDLGLVAAMEWQLKDFQKRTGMRCEFFLPAENISLDADLSTGLFRIFQEALTNVARHSDATEVYVRLHSEAGSSTLEVEDNGKGIEEEKILSSRSLGLLGMRERALMFGGRITVTGTPGIGTTVTVEIPLVGKR
jgi:PAS domain S-box-containing protein